MTSRRKFIGRGLSALAYGLVARNGFRATPAWAATPVAAADPILSLPASPHSLQIGGLPFEAWYTADEYKDVAIPFHLTGGVDPPPPSEQVEVAVIGGGISGLSAAYFLRARNPVVFDLRRRFGGNALGESWQGIPFSLGSAYIITPDRGSFLEQFYTELGLNHVVRTSFPPDPMELNGKILDDFWSGAGMSPEEQAAFAAYAEVVTTMADENYPEIPLPDDPAARQRVLELDAKTFREDVEQQMGLPLTPLLAAGIQSYFYSSFCGGIDEISAAAGWNFIAAEEYGRWVFPGGNAYMARALWHKLQGASIGSANRLRANHRVLDVRMDGDGVLVSYLDPQEQLRSLRAEQVVMAGSKHICKYVLHDLQKVDAEKLEAINHLETGVYLVVNVLLDAPIKRDFYDTFLIGDANFPMTQPAMQQQRPVTDMLRGDYTQPNFDGRSVLTLYWPWPFASGRFNLITEGWQPQAERLLPQLREILALVEVPEAAVRQVRISRWGHALPIARPDFIAGGDAAHIQRPIGGRIHFVNQDNWALPAVENSVLDARSVATTIQAALGSFVP